MMTVHRRRPYFIFPLISYRNANRTNILLFVLALVLIFWLPQFCTNWNLTQSIPWQGYWTQEQDSFAQVFHSPTVFRMNYAEMKKEFKVFMYPQDQEGNPESNSHSPSNPKSKCSRLENYFIRNLTISSFLTHDAEEAHLFFIPFCSQNMGDSIYSSTYAEILNSLISKYPYWNRTSGADHFSVSCHGRGKKVTEEIPFLEKNTVRLMCSPSYDSEYIPHKDVSFTRIAEPSLPSDGDKSGNRSAVSYKFSVPRPMLREKIQPLRPKLGFWVGSLNSAVRRSLLSAWNSDTELDIRTTNLSRAAKLNHYEVQYESAKFCMCPRGEEINSVCLTDSISFGCVPVILSNYYALPFGDILDWNKFSVIVMENDVPRLKEILKRISDTELKKLNQNVLQVQEHLKWNSARVDYDAFHMVMYELWTRRHVTRYY